MTAVCSARAILTLRPRSLIAARMSPDIKQAEESTMEAIEDSSIAPVMSRSVMSSYNLNSFGQGVNLYCFAVHISGFAN